VAECNAVEQWVRSGGSLLLITDHHPWSAANERLAQRLGVEIQCFDGCGKGDIIDTQRTGSRRAGLI
jgi:hypothetical protein